MAVYKWNTLSEDFTKQIILDYINNIDKSYDGKIIEIQSLADIMIDSGIRFYIDKYTKKMDFYEYDDVTIELMKNLGFDKETIISSWKTLDNDKTPNILMLEKNGGSLYGKKYTKPQMKFMPILNLELFEKAIWNSFLLGNKVNTDDKIGSGGFWFTKILDKYCIKHLKDESIDNNQEKYFRIRTIDYEDHLKEIKNILKDGKDYIIPNEVELDMILFD